MKKIGVFLLLGLMILVTGCSSEQKSSNSYPDNTFESNEENNIDDSVTNNENPSYQDPSWTIVDNNQASVITPVESTVAMVYDSVVSINVTATTFTGSGSGVLFSYDEKLGLSYIVTCFHVIEDAFKIEVILTSGEIYSAELVGGYKDNDLAIISIEKIGLCYSSLYSDSDNLNIGSQVVCIGNPLGTLPGSVSSGYLSYVNREIQTDEYSKMTLLQTDVAINSGNSGGGLFNTSGALIGIVNAKYADEDIEGLGFAIPANTVRSVINDIMSTAKYDVNNKVWSQGYVDGDWELGFIISDGRYSTGGWYGSVQYVVYISALDNNETASGSTLFQIEDIINSVNIDYCDDSKLDISLSFSSASELLTQIYSCNLELGDKIIFGVIRNNKSVSIEVELIQFIY